MRTDYSLSLPTQSTRGGIDDRLPHSSNLACSDFADTIPSDTLALHPKPFLVSVLEDSPTYDCNAQEGTDTAKGQCHNAPCGKSSW